MPLSLPANFPFLISQMTSHLIEKAKTALLLSITTVIHVKLESIRIITFEYLLKTVLLTSCHGRYSLSLFFSPKASKLVSWIDFTDAHKATNKLKSVANHTRDLVWCVHTWKDLDVTAVRVARTVHVVEWNGNPTVCSPSRVRFWLVCVNHKPRRCTRCLNGFICGRFHA